MTSSQSFYQSPQIALIPLDARPVCSSLPRQLATMAGIDLQLPEPGILGQLKTPANEKALFTWIKQQAISQSIPVVLALDTIAYGGLISSRVGHEPYKLLTDRIDAFFDLVASSSQKSKQTVFGFSSILRIPAYNNAEEEPDYWANYGKALYDYSFLAHQNPSQLAKLEASIPAEILTDFLSRRTRNFDLNQSHLSRLQQHQLQYLAFCQDDTGAYGLNVQEAQSLQQQIENKELSAIAHVQTGADEVACCLITRILSQWYQEATKKQIQIFALYSEPESAQTIAKFDGIPIQEIVERAIHTCGAKLAKTEKSADVTLWVHTPPANTPQGDHCEAPWSLPQTSGLATEAQIDNILNGLKAAFKKKKPIAIADVAYANGGDPILVSAILDDMALAHLPEHLYGYAGWNTPGNTIGTTIAMAVSRLVAEKNDSFNLEIYKEMLFTRFADDWLYQSSVRKSFRKANPPDKPLPEDAETLLNQMMSMPMPHLLERMDLAYHSVKASFPCHRSFEIELQLSESEKPTTLIN